MDKIITQKDIEKLINPSFPYRNIQMLLAEIILKSGHTKDDKKSKTMNHVLRTIYGPSLLDDEHYNLIKVCTEHEDLFHVHEVLSNNNCSLQSACRTVATSNIYPERTGNDDWEKPDSAYELLSLEEKDKVDPEMRRLRQRYDYNQEFIRANYNFFCDNRDEISFFNIKTQHPDFHADNNGFGSDCLSDFEQISIWIESNKSAFRK